MEGGWFQEEGVRYEAGSHGFVRDLEHTLADAGAQWLRFRLDWPGDGLRWPWAFTFETLHTLEGRRLTTTCTAVNRSPPAHAGTGGLPSGLPLSPGPGPGPGGLCRPLQRPEAPGGTDRLPLTPGLFDQDSLCFRDLGSAWVRLEERDTGRYLQVDLEGAPYLLLWSQPGIPGFVCIEPWTGYPGPGHDLAARPGAVLPPGASLRRSMTLTVHL